MCDYKGITILDSAAFYKSEILTKNVTPLEAAAMYKLEILTGKDLVRIANDWLFKGFESITIGLLATEINPIMSEVKNMFETCLKELNIILPNEKVALNIVLKMHLSDIVSGIVSPYIGMISIDNLIYNRVQDHESQKYVGEILGLQHMFTWYRELQDATDGLNSIQLYYNELPKSQAIYKFQEHLKEEAEKLLNKMRE